MDRRTFLRTIGVAAGAVGGGTLLNACGGGGGGAAAIPAGAGTLTVVQATFELLTGEGRYVTVGVLDGENNPIDEAELDLYLREAPTPDRPESGEVLAGPLPATFAPAEGTGVGVYWVQTDLTRAGTTEIVVVGEQGHGVALVQVVDPQDSGIAVPGDEAIAAPTPVEGDDLGYFTACTQDPPCGMHEQSLDAALDSGRPVVLLFATPAFCQTVVCGPSVSTLEAIRGDGDWGDTVFIHSEIYAQAPEGDLATAQLTEAVQAWSLQSEPWLFTIDAARRLVGRLDGPMVPEIVRSLVTEVSA